MWVAKKSENFGVGRQQNCLGFLATRVERVTLTNYPSRFRLITVLVPYGSSSSEKAKRLNPPFYGVFPYSSNS